MREACDGAWLSDTDQGLLHGAGPATPRTRALRGRPRARRLGRNDRRLAAYRIIRALAQAHSRARIAGRGLQVVSRSAQVWRRSPRRFRHGHRTRRGLDLRAGTCAGDYTVRTNTKPHLPLMGECVASAKAARAKHEGEVAQRSEASRSP